MRLLLGSTSSSSASKGISAFGWINEMKSIVKSEGSIKSLWRGNLVNCIRVFPGTAISCLTYGGLKTTMPGKGIMYYYVLLIIYS